MESDSDRGELRFAARAAQYVLCMVGGQPELGAGVARRDVLVRGALDGGIQPDRDRRDDAEGARLFRDQLELAWRFDVDRADTGLERGADLVPPLADAGENDPLARDARLQRLEELAARDDVRAETLLARDAQQRKRVVGLRRVADERGPRAAFSFAMRARNTSAS